MQGINTIKNTEEEEEGRCASIISSFVCESHIRAHGRVYGIGLGKIIRQTVPVNLDWRK